jgi:hypothetical protein
MSIDFYRILDWERLLDLSSPRQAQLQLTSSAPVAGAAPDGAGYEMSALPALRRQEFEHDVITSMWYASSLQHGRGIGRESVAGAS